MNCFSSEEFGGNVGFLYLFHMAEKLKMDAPFISYIGAGSKLWFLSPCNASYNEISMIHSC